MSIVKMPEHIFLFGHRKQHGKDTCCEMAEKILEGDYCRTFFAKKLKYMAADEYQLDVSLMEEEWYKKSSPKHLNGKTVRDILIEVGKRERNKDIDVWVRYAIEEIIETDAKVGIISDFRFPNESEAIIKICTEYYFKHVESKAETMDFAVPKVHKVLVHRPNGKFVSDGADDQLPDVDDFWDYVIINEDTEDWEDKLYSNVKEILEANV